MSSACKQTVIRCAGCGAEKRETNHWFVLVASATEGAAYQTILRLWTFHNELLDTFDDAQALCGEACVIQQVAKLIRGGSHGLPGGRC